jgi:hypothetical protein
MQTRDDFTPEIVNSLEDRARDLLARWEALDTEDNPCWLAYCSLQGMEEEISRLLRIAWSARIELKMPRSKQDLVEDPSFWRHNKRDARKGA